MMIDRLQKLNPELVLHDVTDAAFRRYGEILPINATEAFVSEAKALYPFQAGTSYVPSIAELENDPLVSELQNHCFGEQPIQIGLCWGDNHHLNGMEYHKSSEVVMAATDLVLMLGLRWDITPEGWDTEKTECFLLPAGTAIELFSTTLHLAPCRVNQDPFYAIIVLPRETNTPLEHSPHGLLWMKNKWLLAHADSPAAAKGATVKISGKNLALTGIP